MIKCKEVITDKQSEVTAEDLAAINGFAKSELTADEVFTFNILLCDNETDRDFERFTVDALTVLEQLFIGKTGIFDHTWSAHGQKARIFKTEVVEDKSRTTEAGEVYTYLKASAYMLRNEENAPLIDEIRGGIKKEVSVGCSVANITCSICGEPIGSSACNHVKGAEYGGKICCHILDEPTDAYEWSFVAVPAQRDAGVIKYFGEYTTEVVKRLEKEAELGRSYLKNLRAETARLGALASPDMPEETMRTMLAKLSESELLSFKAAFEKRLDKLYPPVCQLTYQREEKVEQNESYYKI